MWNNDDTIGDGYRLSKIFFIFWKSFLSTYTLQYNNIYNKYIYDYLHIIMCICKSTRARQCVCSGYDLKLIMSLVKCETHRENSVPNLKTIYTLFYEGLWTSTNQNPFISTRIIPAIISFPKNGQIINII